MSLLKFILKNKKLKFLYFFLMSMQLLSCASLDRNINQILNLEKTCYIKKVNYNGVKPEWYQNFKYDKQYLYVVKNFESSSQKYLAREKNILISKMKLSNLIHKEFMNCDDQNQMVFHIRESKNKKDIAKYQGNNLIKNLVSEAVIENEMVVENNKVFTNFIILSLPKR